VIRGAKILGLRSRDGREYLPETLSSAAALYEGAKVNVNQSPCAGDPGLPCGPAPATRCGRAVLEAEVQRLRRELKALEGRYAPVVVAGRTRGGVPPFDKLTASRPSPVTGEELALQSVVGAFSSSVGITRRRDAASRGA
jgi:hypothetical protein